MKSLVELVQIYNRNRAKNEDWKLSDFKNRSKPLKELIENAVWGREPRLNRDKHQFRVPKKTLVEMVKILRADLIIEEIMRSKCFDDIFTIVYVSRINNFGPLSVYDTSLRLGVIFGHYPTVVFLHQGALEGAKKLLGTDVVEKSSKYFCGNQEFHISLVIFFQNL